MELQVGVKALLKNRYGKYLLVRRNPKKYPEVGAQWDLPGGRINPGTALIENLKREIKEEVGLNYIGEPKLVAAQDIFVHKYTNSADVADNTKEASQNKIEKHVVRLTFTGEINGQPHIDGDHIDARWFSAEEIEKMETAVLDSFFRELLDKHIIKL